MSLDRFLLVVAMIATMGQSGTDVHVAAWTMRNSVSLRLLAVASNDITHKNLLLFVHDSDDHDENGDKMVNYDDSNPRNPIGGNALFDAIRNFRWSKDAKRVFHGRGESFPGYEHLTLDWFPPVWLLTSYNVELSEEELAKISHALKEKWSSLLASSESSDWNLDFSEFNLLYQHRSKTGETKNEILDGNIPKNHVITENGMKFLVRLDRAKNHGIFLDMANGREWVRQNSKDQNVLNLFAYTCGFSIAALMGGATQIVNIDMVDGALKMGQRNHELNNELFNNDRGGGNSGKARFLAHDIFRSWGKIGKLGPYGIIVVDPPSFQKNSFVAKNDYAKILRRVPDLLTTNHPSGEGGQVLICLNAPELTSTWLKEQVQVEAPELQFVEQLLNPDTFPSKDPERGLKVLIYRLKQKG